MTVVALVSCSSCGVMNQDSGFRCVLCGERLDLPKGLLDKNEVDRLFLFGGHGAIADGLATGEVPWDPKDAEYSATIELAVKLALEELWGSMDVVFYRHNPETSTPSLGVKWPISSLLVGIRLKLSNSNGESRTAIVKRPDQGIKGSNYRISPLFGSLDYVYQLSLFTSISIPSGRKLDFQTDPVALEAAEDSTEDAPYHLVRTLTRCRVK